MATQIVRLGNGDSIQVRTGVLRGSGPAGPTGPANSLTIGTVTEAPVADATISGTPPNQTLDLVLPTSTVAGPTGFIQDMLTRSRVTSNISSIAANSDQVVTFHTNDVDELDMVTTSTTFTPVPNNDPDRVISFEVSVTFNGTATNTGYRRVWVVMNGVTTIADMNVGCNPTANQATVVTLPCIYRFTDNDYFSVYCRHGNGTAVTVSAGHIRAIRVGAGPTGPTGPTGPANTLSVGTVSTLTTGASATASITGSAPNQTLNLGLPMGPQGTPGNASSGFDTIDSLGGG
jgi:hypothetical protein